MNKILSQRVLGLWLLSSANLFLSWFVYGGIPEYYGGYMPVAIFYTLFVESIYYVAVIGIISFIVSNIVFRITQKYREKSYWLTSITIFILLWTIGQYYGDQ